MRSKNESQKNPQEEDSQDNQKTEPNSSVGNNVEIKEHHGERQWRILKPQTYVAQKKITNA